MKLGFQFKLTLGFGLLAFLTACAGAKKKVDYSQFRAENPRSILVIPVVNRSVDVNSPEHFLSTLTYPLAERGFYIFPVHMVKTILEEDGLGDANMVHANSTEKLGSLFGADSVLYMTIERWDSQYAVLSTTITVEISYLLKSAKTGLTLWENKVKLEYSPQQNSSGGLGGLLVQAVSAAVTKASPDYIPIAQQVNTLAFYTREYGLPAGPYDKKYLKDQLEFPNIPVGPTPSKTPQKK
jgi:hypothetical protein